MGSIPPCSILAARIFIDAPAPHLDLRRAGGGRKEHRGFPVAGHTGTKFVVGGGPLLGTLKRRYPQVRFVGPQHGDDLAAYFAAADVFVFPSRTDTFGLVLLEALASGVPVAAYPVQGPLDVIGNSDVGVLDEDLGSAVIRALKIAPELCRDFALNHSWAAAAQQFLSNVHPCA